MNSKMIESEMFVLTRKDMSHCSKNVSVVWMLQPATEAVVGKRKREN
jgi:hypothetical protein